MNEINEMENMDTSDSMEVAELIEVLSATVTEAWGLPLGKDKCVIPREYTLNLLDDIRAQLPVEMAEARRLLSAKEDFITNAKREAESIRKAAEEEARRLVEETEIMQTARMRANEIIGTSESKAREVARVANEYVDDALRRTEDAINAAFNEVKNSRARFRGLAGSTSSSGEPEIQTINDGDFDTFQG